MKLPLQCLIVEDRDDALQFLKDRISESPETLTIAATCDNAIDIKRILKTQPIDLIFLDLELNGTATGVDFLAFMDGQTLPAIIITSGRSDYIIDLHKAGYDIFDVLYKPFSPETFQKKITKLIAAKSLTPPPPYTEAQPPKKTETPSHKFFTDVLKGTKIKVSFSEILYLQIDKDLLHIKLADQREVITRLTMTEVIQELPEKDFCRIHRSYAVGAATHISQVTKDGELVLTNGKRLPIGDNYRKSLDQYMNL